jgi:hypothetical protein
LATGSGLKIRLGEAQDPDNTPWSDWHVAGSDDYIPRGGWLKVWIDADSTPNHRDTGTPNLDLTAVRSFGAVFDIGTVGGTTENCLVDRIDYMKGTDAGGLTISGGHNAAPATFQDFLDFDQGTSSNRMGVMTELDGVKYVTARLNIGTTAGCTFNDASGDTIVFADQPLAEDDFKGISILADRVANNIDMDSLTFLNTGTKRATFDITGTAGDVDINSCFFIGLGAMTFTSTCSFRRCVFRDCNTITPNEARFDQTAGCSFLFANESPAVTYSASTESTLRNMVSDLTNCQFRNNTIGVTFAYTGTSIVIPPTMTNVQFSGNSTADIGWDSSINGTMLLSNSNATTVSNLSTGVLTLINIATVSVTAKDGVDLTPIENARVQLEAADGTGQWPYQDSVMMTRIGILQ